MAPVSLVISDVDGTLLDPQKQLTPAAIAAVDLLRDRGIAFAVTSSRPPAGMRMLEAPLRLVTPLSGFNGGLIVRPGSHAPLHVEAMEPAAVHHVLGVLDELSVDAWVYTATQWSVRDRHGPSVDREAFVVGLEPVVVRDLRRIDGAVLKITGVSDDHARVAEAEGALAHAEVSARRSQPRYLDVTSPRATKGEVVARLAGWLAIPVAHVTVIGDGHNDVSMFEHAGVAIAMGNAAPEVQAHAEHVTASNAQDGFAEAMRRFVLGEG
jgi:Cof subfamily protein (haloacid dehalogenase superfamily)